MSRPPRLTGRDILESDDIGMIWGGWGVVYLRFIPSVSCFLELRGISISYHCNGSVSKYSKGFVHGHLFPTGLSLPNKRSPVSSVTDEAAGVRWAEGTNIEKRKPVTRLG